MMNIKKFIAIGLISILTLTGCFNQQGQEENTSVTPTTASAEVQSTQEQEIATKEAEAKAEAIVAQEAEAKVAEEQQKNNDAVKKIVGLGELVGKKQADVINVLGKAEESKTLEDTGILLADYYKQTILEQAVKIEIVYNDDNV